MSASGGIRQAYGYRDLSEGWSRKLCGKGRRVPEIRVGAGGAGMDRGSRQAAYLVEQVGLCMMSDVVGLGDGEVRVDSGVDFSAQRVTDPADAQFADRFDARGTLVTAAVAWLTKAGSTAFHQPGTYLTDGRAQDAEDGHGEDDQADDGVGRLREAQWSSAGRSNEEDSLEDDRLRLIFTCCHPSLPPERTHRCLTLREACGADDQEIAKAFLITPRTLAQRIVRAKAKIRETPIRYQSADAAGIAGATGHGASGHLSRL